MHAPPADARAGAAGIASSDPKAFDGPGHRRPSRPGPFLRQTGAPAPSPRSGGEPGIASVPAPRAAPRDFSPAASRLVTGRARVSCRDASGLAVLMGTGRRAGLPGVSRLAAPAAPVARLLRITGLGRPGAENLPVPGVMAQEPGLGEHHRQEHGHRQLPPRVAHHGKGGPSGRQQPDGDRDLPGAVPRGAAPAAQPA